MEMLMKESMMYHNEKVFTFKQMAEFFGNSHINLQTNFANHANMFVEDEHYYVIPKKERKALNLPKEMSGYGDLKVFTVKGFLLHAKPLRTEAAWNLYHQMINELLRA